MYTCFPLLGSGTSEFESQGEAAGGAERITKTWTSQVPSHLAPRAAIPD